MRIMGKRSVELYKRCLAAKQLETYSKLCDIMDVFNELEIDEDRKNNKMASFSALADGKKSLPSTKPNNVSLLLKKYIPQASAGDLSFLETAEFKKMLSKIPDDSDKKEITEGLKKYSEASTMHRHFREADEAFSKCFAKKRDGNVSISHKRLKAYQEDARIGVFSTEVKSFENNFRRHSRTYLGHSHFCIASRALARIAVTHPEMANSDSFRKISPETYDATIKGFYREHSKTSVMKNLEELGVMSFLKNL